MHTHAYTIGPSILLNFYHRLEWTSAIVALAADPKCRLIAPDGCVGELLGAMRKATPPADPERLRTVLAHLLEGRPFELVRPHPYSRAALDLWLAHRDLETLDDAMYFAVATAHEAPLLTANDRVLDTFGRVPALRELIRHIRDVVRQ